MNRNLLRHLRPYVDNLVPLQQAATQAAAEEEQEEEEEEEEEEGEKMETDEETEEGEDLDRRDPTPPAPGHVPSNGEGRAMLPKASWPLPPPLPPRPAAASAPPAPTPEPKNKLPSFKIKFPKQIWNEVTIEMQLKRLEEAKAAVAAAEATAAAAVATTTTPKKGTKRAHFETVLLVPNPNPVDQAEEKEKEEEEEEDSRPRHRRRIDSSPGAAQSSRPEEATSSLNTGAAPKRSSVLPRAAASSRKPVPARNPYARRYSARTTRSAGPVAPAAPTPVSAAALPSALALADAVAAAATRPSTVEGPRTAWRRLFPQLGCEMSDYKGVPDAWHELMLWDAETRCWRARRPDELYVKKVLGGTQVLRAWHQRTWGLESPMRKEWNRRRGEMLERREAAAVDGENVEMEGSGESSRARENGSGDA
ncbi:hypothetical protein ACET3X_003776 [Alternaria dauci]|uniref:Uncharacterized protein n=1 Tax=Alternaria dauci TaxID=48095 RepID=A0ABR3ULF7_9PLEO